MSRKQNPRDWTPRTPPVPTQVTHARWTAGHSHPGEHLCLSGPPAGASMGTAAAKPPNPRRGASASWDVTNRDVIHVPELSQRGSKIVHVHRQGVLTCEVSVKEGEERFIDESFPWTPMDLPPPCLCPGQSLVVSCPQSAHRFSRPTPSGQRPLLWSSCTPLPTLLTPSPHVTLLGTRVITDVTSQGRVLLE